MSERRRYKEERAAHSVRSGDPCLAVLKLVPRMLIGTGSQGRGLGSKESKACVRDTDSGARIAALSVVMALALGMVCDMVFNEALIAVLQ